MLLTKMQDEYKELQLCQSKVRQRKLPMEVIDAEYQWCVYIYIFLVSQSLRNGLYRDRRKLTFYFIAEKRIDFRGLVRELFRCVAPALLFFILFCIPETRSCAKDVQDEDLDGLAAGYRRW